MGEQLQIEKKPAEDLSGEQRSTPPIFAGERRGLQELN